MRGRSVRAYASTDTRCNNDNGRLRRSAVSLLELTIVTVVMAIGAAVAVPRFSASIEQQRLEAVAQLVHNDVLMLRRYAVETCQELLLEFQAEPALLRITPEVELIGAATSSVAYGANYPGLQFESVNLDGNNTATVNCRGDLINPSTGNPLAVARVFVGRNGRDVELSLIPAP